MQIKLSNIIEDISTQGMNLIFPIILLTLLVVAMFDFAKFFITKNVTDVLRAVITSASAITLIGLHKGTEILLNNKPQINENPSIQSNINTQNSSIGSGPINKKNYLLFIFVIAGGLFVLTAVHVNKSIEGNVNSTTSSEANKNNEKLHEKIDGIIQGPWLTRVCSYILLLATVIIILFVIGSNVYKNLKPSDKKNKQKGPGPDSAT